MRSTQSKDLRLLLGVFKWRHFRIGDHPTAIPNPAHIPATHCSVMLSAAKHLRLLLGDRDVALLPHRRPCDRNKEITLATLT
jgi:hypothetical protein